jgi:hypothetical protein
LFRRSLDWDRRPAIVWDAASVFPALSLLEQNFAIIQSEYRSAISTIELAPKYHEVDPRQRQLSEPDEVRSWRVFFLEALGKSRATERNSRRRLACSTKFPISFKRSYQGWSRKNRCRFMRVPIMAICATISRWKCPGPTRPT